MRLDQIGLAPAAAPPQWGVELADVAIPLDERAPGIARAVVARCLADHVVAGVLDDAQLLVSELVTNSLLHSGMRGDVVVRVHLRRGLCRVEVEDAGCEGVVAPSAPDPAAGSGLGLHLVQTLSRGWGVVRLATDGPTRVWLQLPCAGARA
jgi:anti-sigma regulatory factor (Ser/Thr protein kinase)